MLCYSIFQIPSFCDAFCSRRQCWLFLISPHSASEPSAYCGYLAFYRKHSTFYSFGDEICSCSLWTFTLLKKAQSLKNNRLIPYNTKAFWDLFSVHSYNSLSPKRYNHLLNQLGREALYFGGYNDRINPDYDSAVFLVTNIGLMLSPPPSFNASASKI